VKDWGKEKKKEKKKVRLTTLQPNRRTPPINPRIPNRRARRVPHRIISVDKSIRHRAIIRHGEMVDALAQPLFIGVQLRRAPDIPLQRNFTVAFDLVVNALARGFVAVEHEVVEEGRDGVFGDAGVGEVLDLELRGAAVEADVAVAAGEGAREGVAVELDGEGEI